MRPGTARPLPSTRSGRYESFGPNRLPARGRASRDSATRSADRAPGRGAVLRHSQEWPDRRGLHKRDRPAEATQSGMSAARRPGEPVPDRTACGQETAAWRLFQPDVGDVDHPTIEFGKALQPVARDGVIRVLEGPEPDRLLVDEPAYRA